MPVRKVHPIPAVLLAIVSVQAGAAIAKGLFPALGATGIGAVRNAFAAVVLLAIFRPSLARFSRAQWLAVIPYGVALGVMNLTFYLALERIPMGLAVTIEFLGPLTVAVLGSRRAQDFLWVLLAAVGIVLLAPWGEGPSSVDLIGAMFALVAGACWAGYILLGGRVSRLFAGGHGVATGMLFAAFVTMPFALAEGLLSRLTPANFGAAFGVAMLSSALPYTLEMIALRALPSRTFGILMSLEPATAALIGLFALGEQLSFLQCVAVGAVSLASAGAAFSARPTSRP